MCCPVEAEPTYGRERRTRGGVPPVPAVDQHVAVQRAALHFVYETRYRC